MNICCIDTEHSDEIFNPWDEGFYLTCVGIVGYNNGERYDDIIWFDHKDVEATADGILRVQEYVDQADLLVFHNAKHDIAVLCGFHIDFRDTRLHCTMVSDYLIEGQNKKYRYSLNAVAERYELGQKEDKVKEMWDAGVHTYDIPDYLLGPYCLKDCQLTIDIYKKQMSRVAGTKLQKVLDLHNEFTYALTEMEFNGLLFDKERAEEIIQEYTKKADKIRALVLEGVPDADKINLNSSQQLSALLYGGVLKLSWLEWTITTYKTQPYSIYREKKFTKEVEFEGLGFEPKKRDLKEDGYFSTDKFTIGSLNASNNHLRQIKIALVEYSRIAHLIKSIRSENHKKGLWAHVKEDGRVHPSLNQTVTANGRLSSSNPNGQNFPRGSTSPIKSIFLSSMGWFVHVDLSQIEWRGAAWLSQDKTMIHEINNGVDQHIATVKNLMELKFTTKDDPESKDNRTKAKVFNFRMIYGGSEWGFKLDVNMPNFTLKKWIRIIKEFFRKYYGLNNFHKHCIKTVYKTGKYILPTGRWFQFHRKIQKDGSFDYSPNQIRNLPISGMSGGDILPLMIVIIRRGLRKAGVEHKLALTVHDSLIIDTTDENRDKVAKLCYAVGNNLDKYIKAYYGLDWNVKLECEVEVGKDLMNLKYLPKENL